MLKRSRFVAVSVIAVLTIHYAVAGSAADACLKTGLHVHADVGAQTGANVRLADIVADNPLLYFRVDLSKLKGNQLLSPIYESVKSYIKAQLKSPEATEKLGLILALLEETTFEGVYYAPKQLPMFGPSQSWGNFVLLVETASPASMQMVKLGLAKTSTRSETSNMEGYELNKYSGRDGSVETYHVAFNERQALFSIAPGGECEQATKAIIRNVKNGAGAGKALSSTTMHEAAVRLGNSTFAVIDFNVVWKMAEEAAAEFGAGNMQGQMFSQGAAILKKIIGTLGIAGIAADLQKQNEINLNVLVNFNNQEHGIFDAINGTPNQVAVHAPGSADSVSISFLTLKPIWNTVDNIYNFVSRHPMLGGGQGEPKPLAQHIKEALGEDIHEALIDNIATTFVTYTIPGSDGSVTRFSAKDNKRLLSFVSAAVEYAIGNSVPIDYKEIEAGNGGIEITFPGTKNSISVIAHGNDIVAGTSGAVKAALGASGGEKCFCCSEAVAGAKAKTPMNASSFSYITGKGFERLVKMAKEDMLSKIGARWTKEQKDIFDIILGNFSVASASGYSVWQGNTFSANFKLVK